MARAQTRRVLLIAVIGVCINSVIMFFGLLFLFVALSSCVVNSNNATFPQPCEPCIVDTVVCGVKSHSVPDWPAALVKCAMETDVAKDCKECLADGYAELPQICKTCVANSEDCFGSCGANITCIKACEHEAMVSCKACRKTLFPHLLIDREEDDVGMCISEKDWNICQDSAMIMSTVKECAFDCMGGVKCTAACMQAKSGMSENCALCWGNEARCAVEECSSICLHDPSSATCSNCAIEKCGGALAACTGIPRPVKSQGARISATEGSCKSGNDAINVSDQDSCAEKFEYCGQQCMAEEDCVDNCMESNYGLSANCAACFGQAAVCVKQQCEMNCILSPSSCRKCTLEHCGRLLESCTGIPIRSLGNVGEDNAIAIVKA